MTSAFDPNIFLDAAQTDVNEKRPNIPVENPDSPDGFYTAVVGEVKGGKSGVYEKGDNAGNPWAQMVVPLRLQLGPQVQALGLQAEFTLTDRGFLDLTPQGGIDNGKGKNNFQRKYREATRLNNPGEPFAWRMIQGKPVKVKLAHELYEGNIQERVIGVYPS